MSLSSSTDLSCLTETERGILLLLAEGHTAKSIATLTGRSTNSINERLRDARRKTGLGSSRELARLLRQQENRDERIGVAEPGTWAPTRQPEARGIIAGRHWKGLLMALPLAAVAALAALSLVQPGRQTASPDVAPPTADPTVGQATGAAALAPRALHARLLSETRDAAWADATEAALRSLYVEVPGLAPDLRVRCAATLCEVAGSSAPGLAADAQGRLVDALQTPPLTARIRALGLIDEAQSFRTSDTPPRLTFAAYWTRRPR